MTLSNLETIDISKLTGVGPKAKESYVHLGINSISDLITYLPKAYQDRSQRICIGSQVPDGPWTNTFVKVISKSFFGSSRKNLKAIVEDTQSGVRAQLLGFNRAFLDHVLYAGEIYQLYANQMPSNGFSTIQFSVFEVKKASEASLEMNDTGGAILPVYLLYGSLTQNTVRRDIKNALVQCEKIENDLPSYLVDKYRLLDRDSAIRKLHFPKNAEDIYTSRRSLAFSEVFYMQLMILRRKNIHTRRSSESIIYKAEQDFIDSLDFKLTDDQIKVLSEIRTDMSSPNSMNRLLQGDVGSGKTLVAWVSALHAISQGGQVALMAPTELLARQHAMNAARLFEKSGINIAYLDGQVKSSARKNLLENLKNGNINLVIGTHALFSSDVEYRNLAYVIIDEQHRFGVEQRARLVEKGTDVDILLMSATPIPRTLALTIYGNLNVSTIKTMPKGRLPVITYTVDENHREAMYRAVGCELERGHQAYFVYPRIESQQDESQDESDKRNLKDVTSMYEKLSQMYKSFKGELIHSKLPDDDKIAILKRFSEGNTRFLVATSVVEVGLDVEKATCMVVEHSEIFGLSALHQLRGRVGRSSLQSWCFLSHEKNLTEDGKKRLSVLKRTNDGFEIAEEDLKIRGPGEIAGIKQSGFANFKYASLEKDISMMAQARTEVCLLLEKDPGLLEAENAVIRKTLGELGQCLQ